MSHLSQEQRYVISAMKKSGKNQTEIARVIGKNKSVVSRELSRNKNSTAGEYDAASAQKSYQSRLITKAKASYFTADISAYVDSQLAKKYSPEQIVGVAQKEGYSCVSTERIYQYIWTDKNRGGELYKNLRTEGKRYRKRGSEKDRRGIIKNRVSIDERPKEVEKKERIGDLEIDTIIGKDHKGAILTINDRVAGVVKIKKLNGKNAHELALSTIEVLQDWKPFLKTITADNGKEFAEHELISKELGIDFFFAHPYHSWERGANENLNGLIRQYIPKKTDFDTIDDQFINWVEDEINNRPRKRFEFETPNFILNSHKVAFVT